LDTIISLGPSGPNDGERFALAYEVGRVVVARHVAERYDGDTRALMDRVVERIEQSLATLLETDLDRRDLPEMLTSMVHGWDRADRVRLVVDLAFTLPFEPFEVAAAKKHHTGALRVVATLVGLESGIVDEIGQERSGAASIHRRRNWTMIGVVAGGAAALVVGGVAVVPVIGAAAGLSGAAATAHGLAVLGGGSLASGGFGMAGGTAVIAGVGSVAGLGLGGSAVRYRQLGTRSAREEIVRLQVLFRLVLLACQTDTLKAQEAMRRVRGRIADLEAELADARLVNDANSDRIKGLTELLRALEDSLQWMRDGNNGDWPQLNDADAPDLDDDQDFGRD
jgi:hypothetical protein